MGLRLLTEAGGTLLEESAAWLLLQAEGPEPAGRVRTALAAEPARQAGAAEPSRAAAAAEPARSAVAGA